MIFPFTISDDEIDKWKMAVGCKVITGPLLNVVVAMPRFFRANSIEESLRRQREQSKRKREERAALEALAA